jgi:hypothetical protein
MIDRPKPNTPQAGYAEGLSSFLFEPLKLSLKQKFEESGYFDYISAIFTYITNPEYDSWFPNIQIHIPNFENENISIKRLKKMNISIEIYYYAKHLKQVGYSSNEISHFLEFAGKIISQTPSIKLESGACITINGVTSGDTDFYTDGNYIISMGMITVDAFTFDCVIPEDENNI